MTAKQWRTLILAGCASMLVATMSACGGSQSAPEPVIATPSTASGMPTAIVPSPLPTPVSDLPVNFSPNVSAANDESLILIRSNGDVVLYKLDEQRAIVLLEAVYFWGEGERPLSFPMNLPPRPSPDGKWLLVPTLDQGTWLAAMDGSTRRQISPTILDATWAPDSQQITYVNSPAAIENAPQISVLYVENIVAGDAPRPLLNSEPTLSRAVWSPGCDATPAIGASCGQHIFVFSWLYNSEEPAQALLVNVATGEVTQLGSYAGPGREVVSFEYRWSPDGDEFWVPGPGALGIDEIAFQVDGTMPRPLVSACGYTCIGERRDGELTTREGWTILYETSSRDNAIYAQSPTGEQVEIANAAYFMGTLAQFQSTNVASERAGLVTQDNYNDPMSVWNERILHNVGVSYQLPPKWNESGPDMEKRVWNYRFTRLTGMASLGDDQMEMRITATPFDGNGDLVLQMWIKTNATNGDSVPEQPLPTFIISDYDARYYQVKGEVITFANHPAVRVYSEMLPFAEQIVVPLKGYNLSITFWRRPSAPSPVIDGILDSFVLPIYEEMFTMPTPVAPSPLATP